jgi:hypothetical protein
MPRAPATKECGVFICPHPTLPHFLNAKMGEAGRGWSNEHDRIQLT